MRLQRSLGIASLAIGVPWSAWGVLLIIMQVSELFRHIGPQMNPEYFGGVIIMIMVGTPGFVLAALGVYLLRSGNRR